MGDGESPVEPPPVEPPPVDPHAGVATMLPSPTTRPGRPVGFWVTVAVVIVLLAVAIGLPLALRHGHGAAQPTVAARAQGKVPKLAVFANSGSTIAEDPAAVVVEARALLAGSLPPATLSSTLKAALTTPPAAAADPPLTLGAALALDDPKLPACLASVTGGDALFGIDRIRYGGRQALLVVTADNDSATEASAYVVGTGCAQPGTGILRYVAVPLTG